MTNYSILLGFFVTDFRESRKILMRDPTMHMRLSVYYNLFNLFALFFRLITLIMSHSLFFSYSSIYLLLYSLVFITISLLFVLTNNLLSDWFTNWLNLTQFIIFIDIESLNLWVQVIFTEYSCTCDNYVCSASMSREKEDLSHLR